jgi:hypothetical protein
MSNRQSLVMRKCSVFVGLLVALSAGEAAAQQHIHQPHIPELEIYESVAPESRRVSDYDDADRLLWGVGAWVGSEPGVGPDPARAYGTLNWGQRHSRVSWLALRSHVRAAVPEHSDEDSARESVEGSHRIVGRFGLGDPREVPVGADVKVDGRFDHSGSAERRALSAIDIGYGAYTDMAFDVELGLRKTSKARGPDAAGIAFPVRVGMRRIGYGDSNAPVREAMSRTVGAGMAFRIYDRHAFDGTIMLLGLTYTQTELLASAPGVAESGAPVPPDSMQPGISVSSLSKTRLDFGRTEIAFYDKDFVLAARGGYGWEWLRDAENGRAVNMFAPDVGLSARDENLGIAIGYGRTAQHSADGQRFVADWRIGLDIDYKRSSAGGALRAEASWMNDKERDHDDDPGILGRYAVNSEVWYQLPHDLQIGVYDVAVYGPIERGSNPSWDPWAHERGLEVEMGAFLRWHGR